MCLGSTVKAILSTNSGHKEKTSECTEVNQRHAKPTRQDTQCLKAAIPKDGPSGLRRRNAISRKTSKILSPERRASPSETIWATPMSTFAGSDSDVCSEDLLFEELGDFRYHCI